MHPDYSAASRRVLQAAEQALARGSARTPQPAAPPGPPGHEPTAPGPTPEPHAGSEYVAAHLTYPVLQDPKPGAVVIHCSDPRFQAAFEQFLAHELHLEQGTYIPIIVGGGGGVLAHPEQLPKEFKFLKDRLEHYRSVFPTVRRIILINHEGCRYYEALKIKTVSLLGSRLNLPPDHGREDLGLVARVFQHLLAHLGYAIELYYARFADPEHTRIVFEKVGQ
jgi:hypothetical protein